jgi:iron complex outermembrane receptor protein
MDNTMTFKRSAVALALLATFSAPIFAADQNNPDTTQLETITVLGKAYRNTATKTALEPEETPQGITVLDGELLEQRGVKSVSQALRYAPGVVTEQKGASVTMYDNYSIRGFDNKNVNYYDGLALQYLNGWNLQPQIDPIAIQQIEVFKGPTSVLYGAMPPGGMVNIIAKSPQLQDSTSIGVATGSRNLMEASIDTTGQIGDSNLSYRVIALARKQDSQVDFAEEERYVFAPSLDWQVTDRTLINFNLYYQNDPAMGINSSLPSMGMVTDSPVGSISSSTSAGDKNWSTFEREVLMLGYKINHDFESGWSFLQNARYTDASLYQENTYHYCDEASDYCDFNAQTGELTRNIYSTDESSTGFVIDNQLSKLVVTGDVEHNLLFGFDYQQLSGDAKYTTFGQISGFNVFNPNNNMIDRSQLTATSVSNDKVDVEQLGFYFQDQLRYNALVLIAGGRYDQYESTSNYNGFETKADQSEFSYRVGALYELSNGISPFINYATSFEPVAGVSAFNEPFEAETGSQIEGGVKYQSEDGAVESTVSVFHIVKENVVITDPSSADYQGQLQVGEVTSQGAEFEARWYPTDSVDVLASYTYLDVEITEDGDNGLQGTTPIYVPEHSATLWANYYVSSGALDGARLGGGARYVGEMQMDASNTQGKVPSYTVVDLSLGYDLGYASDSLSGAQANLIINNLFDTDSYTCYDKYNCWYGAEQSIELNVNYEF